MGREQCDEKMTNYKTKTVTSESSFFFHFFSLKKVLRIREKGKLGSRDGYFKGRCHRYDYTLNYESNSVIKETNKLGTKRNERKRWGNGNPGLRTQTEGVS